LHAQGLKTLRANPDVSGAGHATLSAMHLSAMLAVRDGDLDGAAALERETLAYAAKSVGENTPTAILARSSLGEVLGQLGRLDEAESVLRDALERSERALGATHPYTGNTLVRLAAVEARRRRFPESEALARRGLDILLLSRDESSDTVITAR